MDIESLFMERSFSDLFSPARDSKEVRGLFSELMKENPARAQRILDRNTNSLLDVLNQMQFSDIERLANTDIAKKALNEVPYMGVTVPFGHENSEMLVTPGGKAIAGAHIPPEYGGQRVIFPGIASPYNIIHEGTHGILDDKNFMNTRDEEETVRALDYMNAVKAKDPSRMKDTMHFLGKAYGILRPDIFKELKKARGH